MLTKQGLVPMSETGEQLILRSCAISIPGTGGDQGVGVWVRFISQINPAIGYLSFPDGLIKFKRALLSLIFKTRARSPRRSPCINAKLEPSLV